MISSAVPEAIAGWPLAARLADSTLVPNTWRVLLVADGTEEQVAEAMREELAALVDLSVFHLRVQGVEDLVAAAGRDPGEVLVVSGLSGFDEHAWRAVDVNRSRLERVAPTLLVISESGARRLPTSAPNLWSWIGDGVWRYERESGLGDTAREQRLSELRRHFGFDDEELLRRAREGELPGEPEIAEWLVLLGEGRWIPSADPS